MRSLPKPKRKPAEEAAAYLVIRDGISKIEEAMVKGHKGFPSMIDRLLDIFYNSETNDSGDFVVPPAVAVSIFDKLGTIAAMKEAAVASRGLHKASGKSGPVTQNFLQINITPEQFRELPEPLQKQMIDAQILAITKAPEPSVA